MKRAVPHLFFLAFLLLISPASGQTAADEVAAAQRIGQATKLNAKAATDTLDEMLGGKKWSTFTFYVVSQRGKSTTLMYTEQIGNAWFHTFVTADCSTGCKSDMMFPEDNWAYATLERRHNGFWVFTKPANRKFKWTYWNVTSVSLLITGDAEYRKKADAACTLSDSYFDESGTLRKCTERPWLKNASDESSGIVRQDRPVLSYSDAKAQDNPDNHAQAGTVCNKLPYRLGHVVVLNSTDLRDRPRRASKKELEELSKKQDRTQAECNAFVSKHPGQPVSMEFSLTVEGLAAYYLRCESFCGTDKDWQQLILKETDEAAAPRK